MGVELFVCVLFVVDDFYFEVFMLIIFLVVLVCFMVDLRFEM